MPNSDSEYSRKRRLMNRCLETLPDRWQIGGYRFQRMEMLGKGSWAFAFAAKRIVSDESPLNINANDDVDDNVVVDVVANGIATNAASTEIKIAAKTTAGDEYKTRSVSEPSEPPQPAPISTTSASSPQSIEPFISVREQTIAVKAIVKAAHTKQGVKKYPQREVEIMRKLRRHENVLRLYAHWQDGKCFYLALELCTNKSLSHLIKSSEVSLSSEQIKHYLRGMLSGCAHMRRRLVIHRDIKPDNVLLSASNQIKIADFGLSIAVLNCTELLYSICGTPKYQAPEMIRKQGYNFPVDVWAIGCVLYRLHYRCAPFDGEKSIEIYEKLLSAPIKYPRFNRFHRRMTNDELSILRCMLKKNAKFRDTAERLLDMINSDRGLGGVIVGATAAAGIVSTVRDSPATTTLTVTSSANTEPYPIIGTEKHHHRYHRTRMVFAKRRPLPIRPSRAR